MSLAFLPLVFCGRDQEMALARSAEIHLGLPPHLGRPDRDLGGSRATTAAAVECSPLQDSVRLPMVWSKGCVKRSDDP